MSLEKAISHKKEHREEYFGSKAVSDSCRNHGSCAYCRRNRLFDSIRTKLVSKAELKNFSNID